MEQFKNINNNLWCKPKEQTSKARYEYEKHHREFLDNITNLGQQNFINGYSQTPVWDNNLWQDTNYNNWINNTRDNSWLEGSGMDCNALLKQNLPLRRGVKYAQNNFHNISFDRVFHRTLMEEGGFEDRPHKIDTPTNMGFQQATLNRFKVAHPNLAYGYPENIKDLTYQQGKQIARVDFFDKYRIGEIKHEALQETIFDAFFNHSPIAPALWIQRAINKNTNMQVDEDGVFGSQTIEALNSLTPREVINVNNSIIDQRQADYENEKIINQNPNYNVYTVGLPDRFNRFRIEQ